MFLPDDVKRIINLLEKASHKAYAVGGCVRDALMGREVNDYDITTSALPEQVEKVLTGDSIKYIETGLKHGTVTAVINHIPYEITTFRCDGEYKDNRRPESVCFVSDIKEDLSRRDFTVNAIAYNEKEGFVDLFGGRDDIYNKIIRTVGDADKRFNEDALRIMRALRFASQLGFTIEEQTEKAIFRNKELLRNIAVERIFKELQKTIMGENCDEVIGKYIDVIRVVIPEISANQISELPKKDYLRFAVLLNGSDKKDEVLNFLKVSNEFAKNVKTIADYYDCEINNDRLQLKKLLGVMGETLLFDLLELKNNEEAAQIVREIIENNEPYKISDLAINGYDLMALGFRGKEISQMLEYLLDEAISNPAKNEKEILI
ncbi:MAG: CCA tRNA nucleotidyltransferase, partial [Eubacterium sp.]|nr:CCA tRNA nucleotidyltransferase [Eubacterium sp.]